MVYREEESINPLSRDHQRTTKRDSAATRKRVSVATPPNSSDSDNSVGSRKGGKVSREISGQCFAMSRKKVWNSIIRRKKKNHMDLSGKEESDSGSVSPLLRRVSATLPRSGMQMRHTMDPEMSTLCVYDPNHLFVESELKSLSLPRSFPPEITVTQHDEGKDTHS